MRHFSYGLIFASTFLAPVSYASEPIIESNLILSPPVLELVNQCKSAKNIQSVSQILSTRVADKSVLCADITHKGFLNAALKEGLIGAKAATVLAWCNGYAPEKEKTGGKQGEKKADAQPALPKLKPAGERPVSSAVPKSPEHKRIVLRPVIAQKKEGQNMQAAEQQVLAAQEAVQANIILLEKTIDPKKAEKLSSLKARERDAQQLEKKAKETYDNLTIAVMGMRSDIIENNSPNLAERFNNHEVAWAKTQEDQTPEDFVVNLGIELNAKRINFTGPSQQTYNTLKDLLKQAQQNYAAALYQLEMINRELLELNH
ncbi:MAG: hypothetical protein FJX03_06235 [Alphaproteobacteria bacterium]|nr:hypothetical protein [Alphaproteobacteria bacterium]